jgi:hypothetical protein
MRADLSRVWSQYFFNFYPTLFCGASKARKIICIESLVPRRSALGQRAHDDIVDVARQSRRRGNAP